jgi:hypothetical protein
MTKSELTPPAAVITAINWLTMQPYFRPEWRPIVDKLHKERVWHQLGKRSPAIPRAQLIEELSKWSWGEVPDEVLEDWSKSHLQELPDDWSDKYVALLVAFFASFTLAVSDVRTFTDAELDKIEKSRRQEAESLRTDAAIVRDYVGEVYAKELELLAEWSEFEAEIIRDDLGPRLLVDRHQRPPHVRAYCVLLAKVMRGLYAKDLRGTVATIATAALSHTVSAADVRYWSENKSR